MYIDIIDYMNSFVSKYDFIEDLNPLWYNMVPTVT